MKIGELQEHCGECPLNDYCTDPYETPQLCTMHSLHDIDADTYKSLAASITTSEIQKQLHAYQIHGTEYTNIYMGAICDIILEKLKHKKTL